MALLISLKRMAVRIEKRGCTGLFGNVVAAFVGRTCYWYVRIYIQECSFGDPCIVICFGGCGFFCRKGGVCVYEAGG